MEKSNCRACQAPIFWCRTENGKHAPIDAEPVPDGNIVIEDGVARYVNPNLFAGGTDVPRHKNHFATCPSADRFRKKAKHE